MLYREYPSGMTYHNKCIHLSVHILCIVFINFQLHGYVLKTEKILPLCICSGRESQSHSFQTRTMLPEAGRESFPGVEMLLCLKDPCNPISVYVCYHDSQILGGRRSWNIFCSSFPPHTLRKSRFSLPCCVAGE